MRPALPPTHRWHPLVGHQPSKDKNQPPGICHPPTDMKTLPHWCDLSKNRVFSGGMCTKVNRPARHNAAMFVFLHHVYAKNRHDSCQTLPYFLAEKEQASLMSPKRILLFWFDLCGGSSGETWNQFLTKLKREHSSHDYHFKVWFRLRPWTFLKETAILFCREKKWRILSWPTRVWRVRHSQENTLERNDAVVGTPDQCSKSILREMTPYARQ